MLLSDLIFFAFFVVFIVHIIAEKKQNNIGIYITKPLLMPLLAVIYVLNSSNPSYYIVLALFFSFLGDIFLLSKKQPFFMGGLTSFLIGHSFYITAFLQSISSQSNIPLWFYLAIFPYLIYGIIFYRKLSPYLNSLKLPVIIYMVVIILMSFTSLLRFWKFDGFAFWLPFIGSLAFFTSDSLLAVDNFKVKINNAGVYIMSVYIFAQLLIILGMLLE